MQHQPNRINKSVARKLWDAGESFIVVPRFVSPFDAQGNLKGSALIVDSSVRSNFASFAIFCDNFIYYNCNTVTGLYPAFYVLNKERKNEND